MGQELTIELVHTHSMKSLLKDLHTKDMGRIESSCNGAPLEKLVPIEAIKLSDFFKQIKKPRYILGTTYTLSLAFFESSVYPLLNRSNLKSCLIISDNIGYQRALTEGPALMSAAQNYLVVPAPTSGCFHPKVWIIVGENEAAILVGSGNLTQSGFMSNAELFDSVLFSNAQPGPTEVLKSMKSFVSGLSEMWREEDRDKLLCIEILNEVNKSLDTIPANHDSDGKNLRFIHSCNGRMLSQLPNDRIDELFVAAPYFGGSISGLELLNSHFGKPSLHIFPGIHSGKQIDLPIDHTGTELVPATLAALKVPGKNKAHAHLKLYGATSKEDGWILCTSANSTLAAWNGENIEAGILRHGSAGFVRGYFSARKGSLPDEPLPNRKPDGEAIGIPIWATDVGSRLEVTIGSDRAKYLPLKEVEFVIRMGSKVATYAKDLAFKESRTIRIAWSDIACIGNRREMTICLEVRGKARDGSPIHGACFVDNLRLLTADPMHRSAWRGALALLDAEAVPELGDIAAIFGMVDNIFAGRLISQPQIKISPDDSNSERTDEEEQIHVAVWPPQPDSRELQRRIGTKGMGQLRWCQNILEMFLKPKSISESRNDDTQSDSAIDLDDDQLTEEELQKKTQESEKQQMRLSRKIWNSASRDYQKLKNKLQSIVPDSDIAPNVWPVAIFVFLATAAMHRAARRAFKELSDIPPISSLWDGFLNLMLDPRTQHDDFCCPPNLRYQRLPFPSLAVDLTNTFKIKPHPDFSIVMIALLADKKMRKGIFAKQHLQLAASPEFIPDKESRDTCLQIWKQFVRDLDCAYTDDEFLVRYQWLINQMET